MPLAFLRALAVFLRFAGPPDPPPQSESAPPANAEGAAGSREQTEPPADELPPPPTYEPPQQPESPPEQGPPPEDPKQPRTVVVPDLRPQPQTRGRAATVVGKREIEERIPRSAPDALRYEPGVYVQKTAHAQGSPYVRGLTGQQTLLLFDGVRLNNSTFRQGPNQYFFTVDSRTLKRLEVVRGSASTRYGSDAIGGVLLSTPKSPTFDSRRTFSVHPKATLATRTADGEIGGRGQLDMAYKDKIGIIGGVGYRDVGQLRTAGAVISPATGEPHKEPRFESDGVTQKGTGFKELTADARLVWNPDQRLQVVAAYYDYRQDDAPRTDKCPPAEAPESQCLVYDEQYRTLAYLAMHAWDGSLAARTADVTLSFQKQHERREIFKENGIPDRPGGTELVGRDDVYTVGAALNMSTADFRVGRQGSIALDYGADGYFDTIASKSWILFTDTADPITQELSRGQYLDGARYLTSGVWTQLRAKATERVELTAGVRGAAALAQAEGDPLSTSRSVDKTWFSAVSNAGITLRPIPWLGLHARVDQGFRAPNLDDLTSRQQVGPGFQFENPDLRPERSVSTEAGFTIQHAWVEANFFAFQTSLRDLIARAIRTLDECPSDEDSITGCAASRTRFQVVNVPGLATIRGVDGSVRVFLPYGFGARASISWAVGSGPNPNEPPPPPVPDSYSATQPLSRIPPLNGTGEITWRGDLGIYLGTSVRWALLQDKLAPADVADIRIPDGGTPGFFVWDARAGYRLEDTFLVAFVFENLTNTVYRYHGSSVNGPERSLSVTVTVGF